MPSASRADCASLDDSGSSNGSSRSAASTTVTLEPNRANAWASSSPIAPPPRTISESGRSLVSKASLFVQYGVSAKPSIGGITGSVPAPMTTPRRASNVVPSTSTKPGPPSFAQPRTKRAPLPVSLSTAIWSFQSVVASSRIRVATGVQSGLTSA